MWPSCWRHSPQPPFIFINLPLEETADPSHPGRPQETCSSHVSRKCFPLFLWREAGTRRARDHLGGCPGFGGSPVWGWVTRDAPLNIFKPSCGGETELRWSGRPWRKLSHSPTWVPVVGCYLVAKSCLTLCDPMDCSTPGSPVLHCLPSSLLRFMSIESVILSTISLFAFSLSQHQGLFQ